MPIRSLVHVAKNNGFALIRFRWMDAVAVLILPGVNFQVAGKQHRENVYPHNKDSQEQLVIRQPLCHKKSIPTEAKGETCFVTLTRRHPVKSTIEYQPRPVSFLTCLPLHRLFLNGHGGGASTVEPPYLPKREHGGTLTKFYARKKGIYCYVGTTRTAK